MSSATRCSDGISSRPRLLLTCSFLRHARESGHPGATDAAPEALGPRLRGGDEEGKIEVSCLVGTTSKLTKLWRRPLPASPSAVPHKYRYATYPREGRGSSFLSSRRRPGPIPAIGTGLRRCDGMAACSWPETPPRITNDSQMSFELIGSLSLKAINTPTRQSRSGRCARAASGRTAENGDEFAPP
jgi:hypothetical protein